MREIPKTENTEPMRAKERKDKEDPKCRKSSTDMDAPTRAKARRDKDDPR
jgi:hypothetical protein